MRRLRLVAIAVPFVISVPAAAAQVTSQTAVSSSLLVAGTATATSADGSTARIATFGYVDDLGRPQMSVTICRVPHSCDSPASTASGLATTSPNRTVQLDGTVPGLGILRLTFTAVTGNSHAYQCVGDAATFSVEGLDVEESVMTGSIGSWTVTQPGAGVWATSAAAQYVAE